MTISSERPPSTPQSDRRFRWRILPAGLSWGLGGIFLVFVPLILIARWNEFILFPDSSGKPSFLFLIAFGVAGLLWVFAGFNWEKGKWTAAILSNVLALAIGVFEENHQKSLVNQRRTTIVKEALRSVKKTQPQKRIGYEQSLQVLQLLGYLSDGEMPPLLPRPPRFNGVEPLGLTFYKTLLTGNDIENMNIPRTYIGHAEVGPISFRNTNLSESTLCWNDFIGVDFADADLSKCDLRATVFQDVNLENADLSNADLRRSTFENCNFKTAKMSGTKVARSQSRSLPLSEEQIEEIDWQEHEGEEPEGG